MIGVGVGLWPANSTKYLINDIGIPGQIGFGIGIAPYLPAGMSEFAGTKQLGNDNYGNYQFSDGSIVVYRPAFYYKWGTGSNGLAINQLDIKKLSAFGSVTEANAAGYALHRAFINNGLVRPGVFIDKYKCSNNGGIASSIKLGNPLSNGVAHNPFSGLTGTHSNTYKGAITAAKTRGAGWHCNSIFGRNTSAMISYAHGQSANASTCAWFDSAGVTNFTKGNNNNALGDTNDNTLSFISDGFPNCSKTGSANILAKTTDNGQNCGIADVNGDVWEIVLGMTSNGTNFYLLNESVDINTITNGNTLATDAWGATGIAAMYTSIGATYGALLASATLKVFGNAGKVFDESVFGNNYAATCAGIPLLAGGTNKFGNDGLWDYRINELCPIVGGSWADGATAGVWELGLINSRDYSSSYVGLRAALFL